jgi:hypothetical protein
MKPNTRSSILSAFLLAVVICAAGFSARSEATSGQRGNEAAPLQVPFKGTSSGIVTATGLDQVAGIARSRVEGEGQATHIGHFKVVATVAVEVATGAATGTWTITTANGDMLALAMAGHGIDATHGFGAFTVVAGTGRFQGASGFYEQVITFAVPLGTADVIPYTDVFTGTVSTAR